MPPRTIFDLTMVLFIGGTAIFLLVLLALGVALLAGERARAAVGSSRIVPWRRPMAMQQLL